MNWTHRFVIDGWNDNWYLVDIKIPRLLLLSWMKGICVGRQG